MRNLSKKPKNRRLFCKRRLPALLLTAFWLAFSRFPQTKKPSPTRQKASEKPKKTMKRGKNYRFFHLPKLVFQTRICRFYPSRSYNFKLIFTNYSHKNTPFAFPAPSLSSFRKSTFFTPSDKKLWRKVVECGEKYITLASISIFIDKNACDL